MSGTTQQATVESARELTPEVREIVLLPASRRLDFAPGQWISLRLPVGEHPPLARAYSLAAPRDDSGRLVLVFDRVPQGLGSSYLFSLRQGDAVEIDGPLGNFCLPEPPPRELLFLARFTGIVPIRCMLTHLARQGTLPPATLIHSAARREHLIYHDEFEALAARQEQFRYHPVITAGDEHHPADPRREIALIDSLYNQRRDYFPMICGLKAYLRPLRAHLKELGFGRKEMRTESYD
ncbi:MAG: FAD-dependent oxidoreductase [Candidatus Tectomicrobia bacterium]|nr:FAD-dependent oxidoreductase [Candidatus Tectomicrobia bacterium]